MSEIWLPVVGYEGFYEVSSLGRVKSLAREVPRGSGFLRVPEKILVGSFNKLDGRHKVELSRGGRNKSHKTHRLVAEAFLGPPPTPEKVNVLHKDDDHLNNRPENLYWGTQSENMWDRVNLGNHPNKKKTHCPKGHAYDGENTRIYRGMRYCIACVNGRNRENRNSGF